MTIGLTHFLVVSAILFSLGVLALVTRKNAINFIAFSRFQAMNLDGHVVAIFVIILAAVEAAVALAIVLHIYKTNNTVEADRISKLKE